MTSQRNTTRLMVLFALVALLIATPARAQDVVRVPDIGTMVPGEVRTVTVTGTIVAGGVIEVTLDYPANLVRLRSISGDPTFAYQCPSATVMSSTVTNQVGSLTFRCDSTLAVTDQALFNVEIEALYGVSGSGSIVASRLRRDYVDVPTFDGIAGEVRIEGSDDIRQTTREGFTGNYPNPFATASRFVFTLQEAGTVALKIRSLQGRVVVDLGSVQATAGENAYELQVDLNELAQGPYVMQLITDRGSYLHSFMVLAP